MVNALDLTAKLGEESHLPLLHLHRADIVSIYIVLNSWPNLQKKKIYSFLGISIPTAEYRNKKTYLITCNGPCRQIRALIEFNGGDADLFANEEQHPITNGLSCLISSCSMCRAISGSSTEETCSDMATQNGNRSLAKKLYFKILTIIHHLLPCSFYLMVYAYQSFAEGNLQVFGNVQSVELDGECTGSDCQTEESFPCAEARCPPPPPGPAR